MKYNFLILFITTLLLIGCSQKEELPVTSPEQAILKLKKRNREYMSTKGNNADISTGVRKDTAENGQEPYAVIITCSDSRVPPEHIFCAGIGELFVIRTAGNVVGHFELGSIEYGVLHLGAKAVVVMGHSGCGAVSAALSEGHAEGYIIDIVDEIKPHINGATDSSEAENLNIAHSYERIMESEIVSELVRAGEVIVVQAKYDIKTGEVIFLQE